MKVKHFFQHVCYGIFRLLSKINTTFFSNFFIATGYFIKGESEYNKTPAIFFKDDRHKLHPYIATNVLDPNEKIHYFEFGVHWGKIISAWAKSNKNANSIFTGFDTFTGLPEDWGTVKKGTFSTLGKMPDIDDSRVGFCVGLVQDTLPDFLKTFDRSTKLVVHLDFDLYNATLFTLLSLFPYFKKGDLIIFDEYFTITKNHHEYRAFLDFLSLHPILYKPLFKCRGGHYVIELL